MNIEFDFGFGLVAARRLDNGAIIALSASVHARAKVGAWAEVGEGAKVGEDAASLLSVWVTARTGRFRLSLFRVKGKANFTWGCRSGDDLPAYLDNASPPYPEAQANYLKALWAAFVARGDAP